MTPYHFNIEVKYTQDLSDLVGLLKQSDIKFELTKYADKLGTIISFESDYGEYELIKEIEKAFHFYDSRKNLRTGKYDIRIHINRSLPPFAVDNWGRPMNSETIEENVYLIIEEPKLVADVKLKHVNSSSMAAVFQTLDS